MGTEYGGKEYGCGGDDEGTGKSEARATLQSNTKNKNGCEETVKERGVGINVEGKENK